ncbi:MAG: sterol desaturase family protein [Flavobacteriales bacterium]|nr:sterol desaturase family protein [Flavobacteriales bacterium]
MEDLIAYFSDIPSSHRTVILVSGLMFFWMLEGLLPIVRFTYNKWKHAGLNLFFTFTTAIVNFAFAVLIVKTSDLFVAEGWGVLHLIELPFWAQLIIGFMILDLVGAYLIHWMEHKVHWMWKFHVIHHSDEQVDSTSALRHHPGESVFRAVFTLVAVMVAGAPMWMVMVYQSLSVFLSQFNHSNLELPAWLEKSMRWVLITPGMHRVHHHAELPYTDTNYGNIFPFWDRIFGTYSELEKDRIQYGLDVFDKRDDHLGDLLGLPFDGKRYRKGERQ